jgi:hypothetical protein
MAGGFHTYLGHNSGSARVHGKNGWAFDSFILEIIGFAESQNGVEGRKFSLS